MANLEQSTISEYIEHHSPQSPTLESHTRDSCLYNSWKIEGKHNLTSNRDCDMEKDSPTRNGTASRTTATPEAIPNNANEAYDAAVISVGQGIMDFRNAPVFDPSEDYITDFSKLRSLDLLPAIGLAEDEFWSVFSRCKVCLNFITTRTIPYHVCPSSSDSIKEIDSSIVRTLMFPRLLDAHDCDYSTGVSEETFSSIFYICVSCGRYMTQRISFNHHDDDSEDFSAPLSPCVYLRKHNKPSRSGGVRTLKEYPLLFPLHDN